jgi:hypothetical protein
MRGQSSDNHKATFCCTKESARQKPGTEQKLETDFCSQNLPDVYVTGGSGTRNKYKKGGMHWNKLCVRVVHNTQQDYTKSFTKMSRGRSSGGKKTTNNNWSTVTTQSNTSTPFNPLSVNNKNSL